MLGDGNSFADAVAGSTWVVVVLCAVGAALTWAFVRDPAPPSGPDPAVAGDPRPSKCNTISITVGSTFEHGYGRAPGTTLDKT